MKRLGKHRERRLARQHCTDVGAVRQRLDPAVLRATGVTDFAGSGSRDGWPHFSNSRHHMVVSAQRSAIRSIGNTHDPQHRVVVATENRTLPT